jgi:TP901 family phage tail tape measure protein
MAQGSGGYGGANFAQVEGSLRNVALQFTSILELQRQIGASVTAWRTLERELSLARAAAGGTVTEFKQMEVAARNFALTTSFSASQVANAFYSLASAGLTVKETLAASTGVILLAQATMTDLGEASDVTSAALAQFNLNATDSYRISNLFVASTNSSLSTLPKLAFAMRQVGPIAAQVGLSIEDTVASLDKLFDAGLRGEQAGTALRNILSRIGDPMGVGRELLNNLGVDVIDKQTGQMRNRLDVLKDIAKLNLGAGDIGNLTGVEGVAGGITLLNSLKTAVGETTSEWDKHRAEITDTSAAYKQSIIQMQTLDGQLKLMGNSFNDMRITIGQGLAPLLIEFSTWVQDAAISLQTMDQAQLMTIARNAMVGVSLLVLTKGVISGVKSWIAFRKAMVTLAEARAAIAAITALSTATQVAGASAGLMAARFASFAALGGVVAVVVGLGVAMYALTRAIQGTNKAIDEAKIDEFAGNVINRFAGKSPNLDKRQLDGLKDQKDYSEALERQLAAIQRQTNVDSATGAGAGTRYSMLNATIEQARQDSADTMRKLAAFNQEFTQREPAMRAEISKLREYFTGGDINNVLAQAFSAVRQQGGPKMDEVAKQQQNSILASLREISRSSDKELPNAINRMWQARTAAIKGMNISDQAKQRYLLELDKAFSALTSSGPETQTGLRDMLAKKFKSSKPTDFNASDLRGMQTQQINWFNDVMKEVLLPAMTFKRA